MLVQIKEDLALVLSPSGREGRMEGRKEEEGREKTERGRKEKMEKKDWQALPREFWGSILVAEPGEHISVH